jgi:acetyl-CoA carboxylase biotin carboxyl carrier protein
MVTPALGTALSNSYRDAEPAAADTLDAFARHARRLAQRLEGSLQQITIESGDCRLELEWHPTSAGSTTPPPTEAAADSTSAPRTGRPGPHVVTSPRVGTFHIAGSQAGSPGIASGVRVDPGTVLGELETMRVREPVLAGAAGVVAEVLVRDGQMVPYAQPLFVLEAGAAS